MRSIISRTVRIALLMFKGDDIFADFANNRNEFFKSIFER